MNNLRYASLVFCFLILAGGMVMAGGKKEESKTDDDELQAGTYTWIAGGMGGGWHTVAGRFSSLVNEKEPLITIKVIPGGGVGNPASLDRGEADIAWGVGYIDRAAYNGTAPLFYKKHTNMASVAGTLSVDYYHFLAAKDQGITTVEQLASRIKSGQRLKIASPMSGTSDYVMSSYVLEFYGVSYDMINKNGGRVFQAVYGDIPSLFKDGSVDYAIVCLGMPGAVVTEMVMARPSVLLAASDQLIDYCYEKFGTVLRSTGLTQIPGGTYPGIDSHTQALCHSTEILVSPKLPNAFVYTFTKLLNENKDFLVELAGSYRVFDPKTTAASSVQVPLHPGAVKYYKEVGVLK
ncbi:MAG: TAXI family TRAP transporter solute-binding subunit [Treponema sp.]|jgi:TRAP transporter TAXI family solute receptor|nr:TAXI family TRAP transporter solute-binding subunit [Treponema sp.]